MRRLGLVLVVVGLIAAAIWLPREEDVAADATESPIAPIAEVPPAVEFRATRGKPEAPFTERWDLGYPDAATPSQTLTLRIGPLDGTTAPARLTAVAGGDPSALLERAAVVIGGGTHAIEAPPVTALELRLDLLGERLSAGGGGEGATVIAGAFAAQPVGDWRVYRVTFGPAADGPQCFLGLSESSRAAVLLPREIEDGPAIDIQLRALLLPVARRPT